jgi:hypothetical protein
MSWNQPNPEIEEAARLLRAQRSTGDMALFQRSGLSGWWLHWTAPPHPSGYMSPLGRERLRRAELASFCFLGLFVFLVFLLSNSLADQATGEAVGAMFITTVVCLLLNRSWRYCHLAAYIATVVFMLLTMLAIVAGGGLQLVFLPAYDLLGIPIFVVSLVGHRRAPLVYAVVAVAFIVGSYLLIPHLPTNAPTFGAHQFDDIGYWQTIFGTWGMLNRHIGLMLFDALFAYLGARSTYRFLVRAETADTRAVVAGQVAQEASLWAERSSKEAAIAEQFAQQVLTVVQADANGDHTRRVMLPRGHPLATWGMLFNQRWVRAQEAWRDLQRSAEGLRHVDTQGRELATRVQAIVRGSSPATWISPMAFNARVPFLDELAGTLYAYFSHAAASSQRPGASSLGQQPWPPTPPPVTSPSHYDGYGGRSWPPQSMPPRTSS